MPKLAILGGQKLRAEKFPPYNVIGPEEEEAVREVIGTGVLSKFLGAWHEDFYGGPQVRAFEEEWASFFGARHAVAVNSATSGLYAAIGALGIGPGDEVIVSPYTMSASSVAPLIYNAVPVFADIEEDYFCLSAASIESRITPRTKAIVIVDIFGQPYDADAINTLARKHGLKIIEDCAQAPAAKHGGKWAGTLGDIGVYSLNYHKHVHTGEGGVLVTDDDETAERLRLIRNHAEAVVESKGFATLVNMVGFNYRMTEIEAAIGRQQLKKLPDLVARRRENVSYISGKLAEIPCIKPAPVRPGTIHSYYLHALKFDSESAGVHRNRFIEAVKAELPLTERREKEGVKIGCGYLKPLYLQPVYQQRTAFGSGGCPWTCEKYSGNPDYSKGSCPVTERMYEQELFTHELMHPGMTRRDMDDFIEAFRKVWENRGELV